MNNKVKWTIGMILLLAGISGCAPDSDKIVASKIENFSQINYEEIVKYKDTYVGDNSAVGNIINLLPGNGYRSGFELVTDKQPYEIIINYKQNEELGLEEYNEFWMKIKPEELLEKNAIIILTLVKNAGMVKFNVNEIDKEFYEFRRKDLEMKYGEEIMDLWKDEKVFKDFLSIE